MKQGRNELCNCGSGIKYKKCCEKKIKEIIVTLPSNKVIQKQLNKLNKLIHIPSDEILLEWFNNSKKLKYVVSVDNLPFNVRGKIIELSKIIEPKTGECESYSQYISLNIPEVKQVRGFFQIPYTRKHKEKFIKDKYFVKNVEYNRVYSDENFKDVVDKNGEVWSTHCWNEYNGIHFDCLKDYLNWNEDGSWFDYRISHSHPLSKIVSKEVVENVLNPEYKKYFIDPDTYQYFN